MRLKQNDLLRDRKKIRKEKKKGEREKGQEE